MTARLEYVLGVVSLALAALCLSILYLRLIARRKLSRNEDAGSAGIRRLLSE